MRGIINMILRRKPKPVDKKSANHPFQASRNTATAIQRDDSLSTIAMMNELDMGNYDYVSPYVDTVEHYPHPAAPSVPEPAPSSSDSGGGGGGD